MTNKPNKIESEIELLRNVIAKLRVENEEAQATLAAIRNGEVDGLFVESPTGDQVFTLKTSEHPYRVFVEKMNEGAATVTADGTIVYCNKCFSELLRIPHEKILGSKIETYIDPQEQLSFEVLFDQGKVRASRGEFNLKSVSGPVPVHLSFAKVEIENNLPGACLVATDLRERKRIEAVSNEQKWLDKLLDLMPTPVILLDKKTGAVIFANRSAEQMGAGGLSRYKTWAEYPVVSSAYGKEGKPLASANLPGNRAARGEKVRGEELVWETPSGKYFLMVDAETLPAMHGRPEVVVLTLQDVSKLKIAEEELVRASSAKSEFLANMSHEIRTPLGAVLGFTELLSDPSLTSEERANFIEVISRNGKQLANLVDDILDLSKIEAGKIEVEKLEVSLPRLVAEVVALFRMKAESKGLKLSLEMPEQVPRVIQSDPTRIRQILVNLIGNAIKFTDSGAITVRARLEEFSMQKTTKVVFTVKDTGIGISNEQKERLFKPFAQADMSTTRKFGGTGLGLVLSKKLAQALGGDLNLVESELGGGSVFEFTIDAGNVAHTATPQALSPHNNLDYHNDQPLAGLRILLADDSHDNQVLIKRILSSSGATVDAVDNGAKAIEAVLTKCYDIVLMDIQMPVLDGYQATSELRGQGFNRPIIALTAHALKEEKERSTKLGFNDHITKPINRNLLVSALSRYVH